MILLVSLFVAVAVAALLPLWRLWAEGPAARVGVVASSALMVAAVVLATAFGGERKPELGGHPIEVHEVGYVGSRSCRSCHPGEHASWHGSYHRTMTQVVSREALRVAFDRLELDWFGKKVVLEWRGDQLWTVFDRGGRNPMHVERPIEQLTGSHHLQVLWYSTGNGRELGPVPMCFKTEERLWLPLTSVFVLPPEFRDPPEPGAWNKSCAMCHTTDARPRVDIGRVDTHVSEFGIACEAVMGREKRMSQLIAIPCAVCYRGFRDQTTRSLIQRACSQFVRHIFVAIAILYRFSKKSILMPGVIMAHRLFRARTYRART